MIAPDLPGIGDSAIPADGLDMKSAAMRIHTLTRALGLDKAAPALRRSSGNPREANPGNLSE